MIHISSFIFNYYETNVVQKQLSLVQCYYCTISYITVHICLDRLLCYFFYFSRILGDKLNLEKEIIHEWEPMASGLMYKDFTTELSSHMIWNLLIFPLSTCTQLNSILLHYFLFSLRLTQNLTRNQGMHCLIHWLVLKL